MQRDVRGMDGVSRSGGSRGGERGERESDLDTDSTAPNGSAEPGLSLVYARWFLSSGWHPLQTLGLTSALEAGLGGVA